MKTMKNCDEVEQATLSYQTALIYAILEKIENNELLNPIAH